MEIEEARYYNEGRSLMRENEFARPKSNMIQILTFVVGIMSVVALIVVIGVTSATLDEVKSIPTSSVVTVAYQSLGLPGYEGLSWEDVVTRASGHTVNYYAQAGALHVAWVNDYLSPSVKKLYNIDLKHTGVQSSVIVSTIQTEMTKGFVANGSIDLSWLNGNNFATLKNAGYLYGPWATKVPNAVNFDFNSPSILYDFGTPTNGYEFPYNAAQIIFITNTTSGPNKDTSKSIDDLRAWMTSNPGLFTYAAPARTANTPSESDQTGGAFVRTVWKEVSAKSVADGGCGHQMYDFAGTAVDSALYEACAPSVFKYLRELEPFLYEFPVNICGTNVFGNNNNYAFSTIVPSAAILTSIGLNSQSPCFTDVLFGQGDISLTLSFSPGYTASQINKNMWPHSAYAFVLSDALSNVNFFQVPVNSPNKLAAMVVANYVGSAEMTFSRYSNVWNILPAFDPSAQAFIAADGTSSGWNTAIEYARETIPNVQHNVDLTTLSNARVGDLSAAYQLKIAQDWWTCVAAFKGDGTDPSYCG